MNESCTRFNTLFASRNGERSRAQKGILKLGRMYNCSHLSPSWRGSSPTALREPEARLADEARLRPESIGNYDGTDGLTIGDLPEIMVAPNEELIVKFIRRPTMIIGVLCQALKTPESKTQSSGR